MSEDLDTLDLSELDEPFAVKYVSSELHHKTEFGAVKLGVNRSEVAAVCRQMEAGETLAHTPCEGFLVEEMGDSSSQEIVIGGMQDSTFGPVVMLGIGGIFLEVLDDVVFRICPIDADEVQVMIDELAGSRLLRGYRGSAPVDLTALSDALLALAGPEGLLMSMQPTAIEVDINPLLVSTRGAVAVDAQVLVATEAKSDGATPEQAIA